MRQADVEAYAPLTRLAQHLWQSGDGLQPALPAITKAAAHVLGVERVCVWRYDPNGSLHREHGCEREYDRHHDEAFDEHLAAADSAPEQSLPLTRLIRAADIDADFERFPAMTYMQRHRAQSFLKAQMYIDGKLHER